MFDMILWIALLLFACLGFVEAAAWVALRTLRQGHRTYRVVPVGVDAQDVDGQLAALYTMLEWESNAVKGRYILYDMGLEQSEQRMCETFAQSNGLLFAHDQNELETFLKGN